LRQDLLKRKGYLGDLPPEEKNPEAEQTIQGAIKAFWQEQEDRNKINLFERENLRNLLIETRNRLHIGEITQNTANDIRREVRETGRKLDCLNQVLPLINTEASVLPRGAQIFEIETPNLGKLAIRTVTLDTRSEQEKAQQTDVVPTIFIAPWSADFQSPSALTMPLAVLSDRPVVVLSLPEHYTSQRPKDWVKRLKKAGNFSLHAEMVIEVIKKLGFNQVDLVGISAGGEIALAVGQRLSNNQANIAVNNLNIFNTPGFEGRNGVDLLSAFTIRTGLQTMQDQDAKRRLLIVQRGIGDFKGTGSMYTAFNLLTKKLLSSESLALIKTLGKFRMFFGDKDVVASSKPAQQMVGQLKNIDPENKLQFILVKGGNHGMATSKAAFFANVMAQDQEVSSEVKVDQLPSTLADLLAQKYHILRIV